MHVLTITFLYMYRIVPKFPKTYLQIIITTDKYRIYMYCIFYIYISGVDRENIERGVVQIQGERSRPVPSYP